jgi:hypothetical protein
MKNTVYIITDIETMGPSPVTWGSDGELRGHPMISLGSVAYIPGTNAKPENWPTFTANLELIEGGQMHPGTGTSFWDKNPEAWEAARLKPEPIYTVMKRYKGWLSEWGNKICFCSWPKDFDYQFVRFYFDLCALKNPYGLSSLCIKTMCATILGVDYRDCGIELLKAKTDWLPDRPFTHRALDDALYEAEVFHNMFQYYQEKSSLRSQESE